MSPRALPLAARHGTLPMTEYLAEVFPGPDRAQALSDARAMRSELNRYHVGSPLRTPDPGAVIAAAGKHGDFPHVVESWSPWTKTPPPMSLARYPVGIHVPRGYDGKTPWGLFISMTNAASSSRYPRAFAPTLEKHRIIWAGFDPYLRLFTISPDANTDFCLAILWDMLGSYSIDPSRIYIGGFSLGGQMTEDVLRIHPWPFSGAMFINIGLWGGLARGFNGGAGMRPQVPWTLENLRLVFVEGDYDYNRTGVYEDYTDLLHAGARSISYIQEPMSPHRLINAESFEKAISFLDRESGSER